MSTLTQEETKEVPGVSTKNESMSSSNKLEELKRKLELKRLENNERFVSEEQLVKEIVDVVDGNKKLNAKWQEKTKGQAQNFNEQVGMRKAELQRSVLTDNVHKSESVVADLQSQILEAEKIFNDTPEDEKETREEVQELLDGFAAEKEKIVAALNNAQEALRQFEEKEKNISERQGKMPEEQAVKAENPLDFATESVVTTYKEYTGKIMNLKGMSEEDYIASIKEKAKAELELQSLREQIITSLNKSLRYNLTVEGADRSDLKPRITTMPSLTVNMEYIKQAETGGYEDKLRGMYVEVVSDRLMPSEVKARRIAINKSLEWFKEFKNIIVPAHAALEGLIDEQTRLEKEASKLLESKNLRLNNFYHEHSAILAYQHKDRYARMPEIKPLVENLANDRFEVPYENMLGYMSEAIRDNELIKAEIEKLKAIIEYVKSAEMPNEEEISKIVAEANKEKDGKSENEEKIWKMRDSNPGKFFQPANQEAMLSEKKEWSEEDKVVSMIAEEAVDIAIADAKLYLLRDNLRKDKNYEYHSVEDVESEQRNLIKKQEVARTVDLGIKSFVVKNEKYLKDPLLAKECYINAHGMAANGQVNELRNTASKALQDLKDSVKYTTQKLENLKNSKVPLFGKGKREEDIKALEEKIKNETEQQGKYSREVESFQHYSVVLKEFVKIINPLSSTNYHFDKEFTPATESSFEAVIKSYEDYCAKIAGSSLPAHVEFIIKQKQELDNVKRSKQENMENLRHDKKIVDVLIKMQKRLKR